MSVIRLPMKIKEIWWLYRKNRVKNDIYLDLQQAIATNCLKTGDISHILSRIKSIPSCDSYSIKMRDGNSHDECNKWLIWVIYYFIFFIGTWNAINNWLRCKLRLFFYFQKYCNWLKSSVKNSDQNSLPLKCSQVHVQLPSCHYILIDFGPSHRKIQTRVMPFCCPN